MKKVFGNEIYNFANRATTSELQRDLALQCLLTGNILKPPINR